MYQCLETIQLSDGIFKHVELHQQRIDNAYAEIFPTMEPLQLSKILSESHVQLNGVYKARLLYGTTNNSYTLQFEPYIRRNIQSLKLISANIEHRKYKTADRSAYNNAFAQRGSCDDVLIEVNGLLTDTSYCNIALFDGKNWHTPSKPLLHGVQRKALLLSHSIIERAIEAKDLKAYKSIRLFNAMIEFGAIEISVENIET